MAMAMAMDMDMDMDMAIAMVFDESFLDLDFSSFSNCTTTTTTTTTTATTTPTVSGDEHVCNWKDWSPVVDWDELSGSQDDFHRLIESMADDFSVSTSSGLANHGIADEMVIPPEIMMSEEGVEDMSDDSKGLRIVHLLMAAAEAISGEHGSWELARVILDRLKDLVSPTDGSNMERLAGHFADALRSLLEGTGGPHSKQTLNNKARHNYSRDGIHQTDILAAFQLLQDMSPYVKFGHFTANQAILEAVTHDRRVHIVDYDIMEGIQWASLMQAFVSRKEGPPPPHLRITAVSRGGSGRRSIGTVQETGRRLVSFAASIGLPFSFHHCRLNSDETFKPSSLKLVRGEALVFNCMIHLPHFSYRSPESIASFLSEAKRLNPRLVTLVEEEVGPSSKGGFVERFMDSLHHYSAVYDSLEAGFPMQERARALVERVFLGPRITESLARIYRARESEEGMSWGGFLGGVGYSPLNISFANHCQAKLLLGLFNDGYRVEELAKNKLVLSWKSRRLLSASIWTASNNSDL